MSLPTRGQAFVFLEPLRGKSTIFLVANREANLRLSSFILRCLTVSKIPVVVFDTSCFYGINIRSLTNNLSKTFLQQSTLVHPSDDVINDEDSLAGLVVDEAQSIMIDDLNTLLHILSIRNQKSGIHRLSTFYHILSYSARINRTLALGVVYKTNYDQSTTRSNRRSLPSISDLQVNTEIRTDEMVFRCPGIGGWPGDRFRVPLYFDERT